jgi:glycine/D-amino acid oxidase-like deaminating enzyme
MRTLVAVTLGLVCLMAPWAAADVRPHKVVSCTGTAAELFPANNSRRGFEVYPTNGTIAVGTGKPDALTYANGVLVTTGQGYVSTAGEKPIQAHQCITNGGTVDVRVVETLP